MSLKSLKCAQQLFIRHTLLAEETALPTGKKPYFCGPVQGNGGGGEGGREKDAGLRLHVPAPAPHEMAAITASFPAFSLIRQNELMSRQQWCLGSAVQTPVFLPYQK